jgi:uncharacterized membrane protein YeiH
MLVFALEGALIAARAGLDLLGIVVIGFVAALGGGIFRDVLLGAVPPAAIVWSLGVAARGRFQ